MSFINQALRASGLDARHLNLIQGRVKVRSYEPGETIVRRGDSLTQWVYLASGIMVANVVLDDGEHHPMTIFGEGSWMGEYTIVAGRPLPCDWVGVTPVTVLMLDASVYLQLLNEVPGFATARMRQLANTLQWSADSMVVYKTGNPLFKCVFVLCVLCEIGIGLRRSAGLARLESPITIPVSQDVLARLSGSSRSRYSEYLQDLERRGLIDLRYRNFKVQQPMLWARWLELLRMHHVLPAKNMTADIFADQLAQQSAATE